MVPDCSLGWLYPCMLLQQHTRVPTAPHACQTRQLSIFFFCQSSNKDKVTSIVLICISLITIEHTSPYGVPQGPRWSPSFPPHSFYSLTSSSIPVPSAHSGPGSPPPPHPHPTVTNTCRAVTLQQDLCTGCCSLRLESQALKISLPNPQRTHTQPPLLHSISTLDDNHT